MGLEVRGGELGPLVSVSLANCVQQEEVEFPLSTKQTSIEAESRPSLSGVPCPKGLTTFSLLFPISCQVLPHCFSGVGDAWLSPCGPYLADSPPCLAASLLPGFYWARCIFSSKPHPSDAKYSTPEELSKK